MFPDQALKLWEEVCTLYDRRFIGRYEFDEMKATIWPVLQSLCLLKEAIDGCRSV